MDLLTSIKFVNLTSGETEHVICKTSMAKTISEWYAAFHAGDDFKIYDGQKLLKQDQNGALLEELT